MTILVNNNVVYIFFYLALGYSMPSSEKEPTIIGEPGQSQNVFLCTVHSETN